jgi:hypothetical protein
LASRAAAKPLKTLWPDGMTQAAMSPVDVTRWAIDFDPVAI